MTKKKIVILGSTGSIGEQALQVIEQHSDKFEVLALVAKDEYIKIAEQAKKFKPKAISLSNKVAAKKLNDLLIDESVEIIDSANAMEEMASMDEADIVLVALSGAIGIMPTISALKKSKRVALANKETLVAAGDIVMNISKQHNAEIIPVDSEHSAIFQCLAGEEAYVKKIILTASGGPFREFRIEEMQEISVEMALKHPNWKMGPKITIDSATMMNKGLEVIEAHHLFNLGYNDIEVLVHRESAVHSMVHFIDGSFMAHLGVADMRIPIQYAFTYPKRLESLVKDMDFAEMACLHFEKPDYKKFPALALAYDAGNLGGTMPAVLNAANEVAVEYFLLKKIAFRKIADLVKRVMDEHKNTLANDLELVLATDAWARKRCQELIFKEDN